MGIGELLATLQAVEAGWGANDLAELQQVARLIWCHSLGEQGEFNLIWEKITPALLAAQVPPPPPSIVADKPLSAETHSHPTPPVDEEQQRPSPPLKSESSQSGFTVLPIQAPFQPAIQDEAPELHAYWPLSQREMIYAWRYLRRPIADGVADVLDIAATIAQATRQGVFLGPVYRRREQNHAHLYMLMDQNGSMMPFHRFTVICCILPR